MRTIITLIAIALAPLTLGAQQTARWNGSADIRYAGKHVFRGVQQSRHAAQAGVEFDSAANGLYAGAWANQPFDGDGVKYGNEIDLYGGYRCEYKGIRFDGGLTAYLYPEAEDGATGSSYELSLAGTYEVRPRWDVTAAIYYDMRLEARTFEASTSYSIPFKLDHYAARADFSAHAGNAYADNFLPDQDGPNVKKGWTYFGAIASVTVQFNGLLSATAGIQYGTAHGGGFSDLALTNKVSGFVGLGLSW